MTDYNPGPLQRLRCRLVHSVLRAIFRDLVALEGWNFEEPWPATEVEALTILSETLRDLDPEDPENLEDLGDLGDLIELTGILFTAPTVLLPFYRAVVWHVHAGRAYRDRRAARREPRTREREPR